VCAVSFSDFFATSLMYSNYIFHHLIILATLPFCFWGVAPHRFFFHTYHSTHCVFICLPCPLNIVVELSLPFNTFDVFSICVLSSFLYYWLMVLCWWLMVLMLSSSFWYYWLVVWCCWLMVCFCPRSFQDLYHDRHEVGSKFPY